MAYNIKYKIYTSLGKTWLYREEMKFKTIISLGDSVTYKNQKYFVVAIENMTIKENEILNRTRHKDMLYFLRGELYLILEDDI